MIVKLRINGEKIEREIDTSALEISYIVIGRHYERKLCHFFKNLFIYSSPSPFKTFLKYPFTYSMLKHRNVVSTAMDQNPIFTNILPIFSPLNRHKKALGAFSILSITVSLHFILPSPIHLDIST